MLASWADREPIPKMLFTSRTVAARMAFCSGCRLATRSDPRLNRGHVVVDRAGPGASRRGRPGTCRGRPSDLSAVGRARPSGRLETGERSGLRRAHEFCACPENREAAWGSSRPPDGRHRPRACGPAPGAPRPTRRGPLPPSPDESLVRQSPDRAAARPSPDAARSRPERWPIEARTPPAIRLKRRIRSGPPPGNRTQDRTAVAARPAARHPPLRAFCPGTASSISTPTARPAASGGLPGKIFFSHGPDRNGEIGSRGGGPDRNGEIGSRGPEGLGLRPIRALAGDRRPDPGRVPPRGTVLGRLLLI